MVDETAIIVRGGRIYDPDVTDADAILIEGGSIAAVGRAEDLALAGSAMIRTIDLRPFTVVPGFVDTHVHATGAGLRSTPADIRTEDDQTQLMRAIENGLRALREGVTTMRDCGARNEVIFTYRDAARRGTVTAPRVLACGSPLTRTGGHGHWWGMEADTPDEIRRAIRRQSKLGADALKVMVDGGIDTGGKAKPGLLLFDADTLSMVVAEAADWGLPVAAHCLTTAGIRASVSARVHSIEHAIFYDIERRGPVYDEPLAQEIADARIWVGPGQAFAHEVFTNPGPDDLFATNATLYATRLRDDAAMREQGVRLVAGTDAGWYATPFGRYGLAGRMFVDEIGMSPLEALRACTGDAAESLGLGTTTGRLRPGMAADLVALDGDPAQDVGAMARVRAVIAGGRLVHESGAATSTSSA